LNILIAEDNENNYQLIEVYLKGNLLSHARNGQEAFQLFTANKYDIILMDMQMPVMDGLTAIRHIRKLDKTVPIITITANAFDSDKMAALSAGSTDFMAKPIMKSALVEMIRKYIL
jgi:CheY-like chemotaxis protein